MRNYHTVMFNIVVLLFVLSPFLSYDYSIPTMTFSSGLLSVQAQESFENGLDITGLWQREEDGAEVYITQNGSEVMATFYPDIGSCEGGRHDLNNYEDNFAFKGILEGNQVIGKESAAWCYTGSSNPDENGLYIDPFEVTINENGNNLILSIHNRFAEEEVLSQSFSKISGLETVEQPPTNVPGPSTTDPLSDTSNAILSQANSTIDQFSNTFTTTLSEAENPMSLLQQNNLPTMIVFAGLVVAAIGGAAAYAKSKSSKRSQHKGGNVAVITRGGIQ